MPTTNIEQVQVVIERLGLTRFIAYDSQGYTLDHAETETAGKLSELVDELVRNTSGMIRLEAWQAAAPRVPGQRKADTPKVERYSWHIRGMYGQALAGLPVTDAVAPAAPDVQAAVTLARMTWEMDALRARLADIDSADADPDADADADADAHAGPNVNAGLFGMTGDQTFQVLAGLRELVAPLLTPLARPVGSVPSAPDVATEERELLEAFRRFRQALPGEAEKVREQLLTNFGSAPPAQPAPPVTPATDAQ